MDQCLIYFAQFHNQNLMKQIKTACTLLRMALLVNILDSQWLFLCRHHPSGLQGSPWVHLWKSKSLKTEQGLMSCFGGPG